MQCVSQLDLTLAAEYVCEYAVFQRASLCTLSRGIRWSVLTPAWVSIAPCVDLSEGLLLLKTVAFFKGGLSFHQRILLLHWNSQ